MPQTDPIDLECTHCCVLMTSWVAQGSSIRYWQCPTCGHTHSSLYSEAFARGAGARPVEAAPVRAPAAAREPPQASLEEIRWHELKARAARWFARLEQEQGQHVQPAPALPVPSARAAPARLVSVGRVRVVPALATASARTR